MMPDREKVIKGLEQCTARNTCTGCPYLVPRGGFNQFRCEGQQLMKDSLAMLKEQQQQIWELQDQVEYLTDKRKEQEGLLGIQQTADGITFVSTGTAQQGESRGLLLGKYAMHEWLKKELLHRGLLTDEIRSVFDEAKRI